MPSKSKWEEVLPVGYPNCPDQDIERSLEFIYQRIILQELAQNDVLEVLPLMHMMQNELDTRRMRRSSRLILGLAFVGIAIAVIVLVLVWQMQRGGTNTLGWSDRLDHLVEMCEKATLPKQCPMVGQ